MKTACNVLLIAGLVAAFITRFVGSAEAQTSDSSITRGKTSDGVEYGLWGKLTTQSAPTLFVLAGTIDGTLETPTYRQCGSEPESRGYACDARRRADKYVS